MTQFLSKENYFKFHEESTIPTEIFGIWARTRRFLRKTRFLSYLIVPTVNILSLPVGLPNRNLADKYFRVNEWKWNKICAYKQKTCFKSNFKQVLHTDIPEQSQNNQKQLISFNFLETERIEFRIINPRILALQSVPRLWASIKISTGKIFPEISDHS